MPVKSAKQYRFMQMMAHNPGKSKKGLDTGPSKEVAREMIEKTPSKKRKEFARK